MYGWWRGNRTDVFVCVLRRTPTERCAGVDPRPHPPHACVPRRGRAVVPEGLPAGPHRPAGPHSRQGSRGARVSLTRCRDGLGPGHSPPVSSPHVRGRRGLTVANLDVSGVGLPGSHLWWAREAVARAEAPPRVYHTIRVGPLRGARTPRARSSDPRAQPMESVWRRGVETRVIPDRPLVQQWPRPPRSGRREPPVHPRRTALIRCPSLARLARPGPDTSDASQKTCYHLRNIVIYSVILNSILEASLLSQWPAVAAS